MHTWKHVNRQRLQKLIKTHVLEINYEDRDIDYGKTIATKESLITENYASKSIGEIFGRKLNRIR